MFQQDAATLEAFGCPDGPGLLGTAQSWPFEHGYIVGFDMTQEMLVVYTDTRDSGSGSLCRKDRRRLPRVCHRTRDSARGQVHPDGRFGQLWQQGERRNELGFATAPAPGAFSAVYQTFPGALIILNQNSGQVVVLPTNNQR